MEEVVSTFVAKTCRIQSQPNRQRFSAWLLNAEKTKGTWALTAAAESYVSFMFPDEQDTLSTVYRNKSRLAVTSSRQLPAKLPATFDDVVFVYEIINKNFPGYVELRQIGQMRKLRKGGEYTLKRCELLNVNLMQTVERFACYRLATPKVHVQCLEWPSVAAEWPVRSRMFGWPDDLTIHHVVRNGCDLVPRCRHFCDRYDEWPTMHTWSFTFRVAETILFNTWNPVQHMVYHVLRIIGQREFVQYVCISGYRVISIRHLKVLMLWMSERNENDNWNRSTVVATCASAMQLFARQFKQRSIVDYFMHKVDLLECYEDSLQSQTIASHLQRFADVDYLTDWMISNYVSRCAQQCPEVIRRLFDDVTTLDKMTHAMSTVTEWRNVVEADGSFAEVKRMVKLIPPTIDNAKSNWNLNDVVTWRKNLWDVDQRFDGYFASVVCLANATILELDASLRISDYACDMVAAMVTSIDKSNKMTVVEKSDSFLLKKAAYLLRLASQTSSATTRSILLTLSGIYLRRAQRCRRKPTDSSAIRRRLIKVYMAIAYYAAGRHREAERLCTRILTNSNCRNASPMTTSDVVEGQHLLNVGEGAVSTASGLVVLYQFVHSAALNRPSEASRSDVFNAELFSRHLRLVIRDAMGMKAVTSYQVQQYSRHMRQMRTLSCGDCLLFCIASRSKRISAFHSRAIKTSVHFTSTELCRLLIEFSVEQLTLLQQTLSRDYSSTFTLVATDIKAIDAYRRGQYGTCLRLSKENITSLLQNIDGFYRFPLKGCMTHLMDDDLASLSGVLTLVLCASERASITQVTLSLYSLVQSQMKIKTSTVQSIMVSLRRVVTLSNTWGRLVGFSDESALHFIYRKAIIYLRGMVEGQ
jgi:hypothetical protein